jgi:hypothetical protein
MTEVPCQTCRSPLLAPEGYWTGCAPCETAATEFNRRARNSADSDYAYHELAHHVMLFRCLPKRKADWDAIQDVIELFPMGKAQIHEMRTLALQFVTYEKLGWRPTVERLVCLSWGGIKEVDDTCRYHNGRYVVHTEPEARRYVEKLMPTVSARNVRLYANAVRELRGEA